jgi:hypothetical protein
MTPAVAPTLVSILGTNPTPVHYELHGSETVATTAAAALAQLMDPRPDRIIPLCTAESRDRTLPQLQHELGDRFDIQPRLVALPRSPEEVPPCVETFVDIMPADQPVVLDLTNGPRHLAALGFVAGVLATALGRAEVQNVFYAWLLKHNRATFIELHGLLEVLNLAYGVRVLEDTGSALALAGVTGWVHGQMPTPLTPELRAFSDARLAGLPLEQGKHAGQLLRSLRGLRRALRARHLPLADKITKAIEKQVESAATPETNKEWKRHLTLDSRELARQQHIIDERIHHDAWNTALGMMEEWVISWLLFREQRSSVWLDRTARREAAHRLHSLRTIAKVDSSRLSQDQRRLAAFWEALSDSRNGYAHAGMRPEVVDPRRGKMKANLERVLEGWEWLQHTLDVDILPEVADCRQLMVTPLGSRPGALFTALMRYPDLQRCVVLCSSDSRPHLFPILNATGTSVEVDELLLGDPFGGAQEVPRIIAAARPRLLDAEHVLVHLTGGTTLMTYACMELGREADRLGRTVSYFLSLDRRSDQEQVRDPYVLGQVIELREPQQSEDA